MGGAGRHRGRERHRGLALAAEAPAGGAIGRLGPAMRRSPLSPGLKSASEGRAVLLGDPMELALFDMARELMPAQQTGRRVDEWPFDASRMRQSVVIETGSGRTM